MKLLENRNALITGAGTRSGIGFATARLFAEHGAKVALLDLEEAHPEQRAKETGALGFNCDVRDKTACEETIDEITSSFGKIHILVGNAGIVYGTPLADISQSEYDEVLDTNLKGNFNISQAIVPHMPTDGTASITLISSIAGQTGGGVFGRSHYAAAKSGIFGLAKALARELAPQKIRANAIAPGCIDNDFTRGKMTREIKDQMATQVPLGRLGTSKDIANSCLFLASDLSSYITGTVLSVNGGLLIS